MMCVRSSVPWGAQYRETACKVLYAENEVSHAGHFSSHILIEQASAMPSRLMSWPVSVYLALTN